MNAMPGVYLHYFCPASFLTRKLDEAWPDVTVLQTSYKPEPHSKDPVPRDVTEAIKWTERERELAEQAFIPSSYEALQAKVGLLFISFYTCSLTGI